MVPRLRSGHPRAQDPPSALPALFVGTLFLADDLEQAGTGLLTMLIGTGLAYHGSTVGRRGTAWVGGAATAIGAAVFLSDMTDDPTTGGMLFLAAGIGLVAAAHAIANALNEPDEMAVTVRPPAVAPIHPEPVAVTPAAPAAPIDDSVWAPPPDDLPPPTLPPAT